MKRHATGTLSLCLALLWLMGAFGALADTLVLPAGLTTIGEEAFAYDPSLDEVVVPEGTVSIGTYAFVNSSVKKITLPDSVTDIAVDAFLETPVTILSSKDAYARKYAEAHQLPWYYSNPVPAEPLPASVDKALKADRDARIREIMGNKNQITHSNTFIPGETYTGRAFYVSNDGDDENDGLSPETPWRTLPKATNEMMRDGARMIQPGDAIFLRRGDVFRVDDDSAGLNLAVKNMTLSAYGSGAKPVVTGSPENGSGEEKWILESESGGRKIWRYYRDMRDVGMIVLNDGKAIAQRVYEYWEGDRYLSCEDVEWYMHVDYGIRLTGGLKSPQESLTTDLTFLSRPVRTEADNNYMGQEAGPLYLRCDAGNPGKVYKSIEFSVYYHAASNIGVSTTGIVVDNIDVRCNACSLIRIANDIRKVRNTLIQNCEFAYCGGCVTFYIKNGDKRTVAVQGDGIYNIVLDATIRNNYFHDCTCTTVGYEASLEEHDSQHGAFRVLDNVMTDTMGLHLDSTSDVLKKLDSVIVQGNHIWNTGSMDVGKYYYSEGSVMLMLNAYGECVISDNVLYGTAKSHPSNGLLNLYEYKLYSYDNLPFVKPTLRNNTYVQYRGRDWGSFGDDGTWAIDDPALQSLAEDWYGDEGSRYYILG